MYISDSHIHTVYSFDGAADGTADVDYICRAAIGRGLDEIAITDHYDINGLIEGYYKTYAAAEAKAAVLAAREKYAGRLRVTYGIELGQPVEYPREAAEFIRKYGFDFVLGSLHNLRGCVDFYYMDFNKIPPELIGHLLARSIEEHAELLDFGGISALAHLTYMHRYVHLAGGAIDFKPYCNRFETLFRKMRDRGVALEVNASTYNRGCGFLMPGTELIRLYRDCGGELITVGSDAHSGADVGRGIREVYDMLRGIGYKYIAVFREGKPEMKAI